MPALRRCQRPVIVAVAAVRVVQVAVDAVVDMVAMRHRLMAAAGAVHMACRVPGAAVAGGAAVGVLARHLDHMLVDVIVVRMMQVALMQEIGVAGMAHRWVAAARRVPVRMIGVSGGSACRHCS